MAPVSKRGNRMWLVTRWNMAKESSKPLKPYLWKHTPIHTSYGINMCIKVTYRLTLYPVQLVFTGVCHNKSYPPSFDPQFWPVARDWFYISHCVYPNRHTMAVVTRLPSSVHYALMFRRIVHRFVTLTEESQMCTNYQFHIYHIEFEHWFSQTHGNLKGRSDRDGMHTW